jgi:SAM-dependent methyltransferase
MNTMMSTSPSYVEVFEIVTEKNFDEKLYLKENKDVRDALEDGTIRSAYQHFKRHGYKEHRKQEKREYLDSIIALRKGKAERIKKLLKPQISIVQKDDYTIDCRTEDTKQKFNFDLSDKVSSFFYDQLPLDIINGCPEGIILDCGAGFRPVYYDNVVNYEIAPYPTTDVLGFAEDLPFADNSFDAVFSFAVLEHVKFPFEAAKEMCRVLKPGGTVAVSAAFLQPLHAYPNHYFNMTGPGLRVLFENDIDIDRQFINAGTGPIATLTWFLREWERNLPKDERKRFRNTKIGSLLGQPYEYANHPFVTSLPEKTSFELASATLLTGIKR